MLGKLRLQGSNAVLDARDAMAMACAAPYR